MIIVLEGLDRSGKSTQIAKIKDRLVYEKKKVFVFREPGATQIGEIIRNEIIKKHELKPNAFTQLFLFAAARAELSGYLLSKFTIDQLYDPDTYILLDRWKASTYAYQGALLSTKSPYITSKMLNFINSINDTASFDIKPSLTLFFDVKLETLFLRLQQETGKDIFSSQKQKFYERAKELYDRYIFENQKNENIMIMNCNDKTIDYIHEQVYNLIMYERELLLQMKLPDQPQKQGE